MMGKTLIQMLLLMSWEYIHCRVEPPQDLVITDLGLLGPLQISWSPQLQEEGCEVKYELHFNDIDDSDWTRVRTSQTSFRTRFDLGREVRVHAYTVLSGACVEGRTVKSQDYTEAVQKPDLSGADGLQDLSCVYYNMEHLVCSWTRSSKMPQNSHETLYYWHSDLTHVQECPHYIIVGGIKIACNFSGTDLPSFSDINLCLNVSSSTRRIRPLFTSLQIQNHVKPKTTPEIRVEMGEDRELRLDWDSPEGRIPQHCLEWEVEESRGNAVRQYASSEPELTLFLPDNETSCVRVRSKLNKYCAESRVWSDWSPNECYPDKKLPPSPPRWDMLPEYIYIAVTIISALVLGLCVWAGFRLRRSKQVKKMDQSFTTVFVKTSAAEFPLVSQQV